MCVCGFWLVDWFCGVFCGLFFVTLSSPLHNLQKLSASVHCVDQISTSLALQSSTPAQSSPDITMDHNKQILNNHISSD